MQRTRIKICGITRPDDAACAACAGADAIGMVLHAPVKRRITVEQAEKILAVLPPFVTPVGLFVDCPTAEILRIATRLGISHVQLHGHESPKDVAAIAPLRVVKAVRVGANVESELKSWRTPISNLIGLILETAGTAQAGGTGVANDWAAIKRLQAAGNFNELPPLIAAGGLNPDNVADVVREIRPWAVDVSSGVEAGVVGEKSPEEIIAFVRAVRQAEPSKG
jgi:phosphoribosylanthranilate isomerase